MTQQQYLEILFNDTGFKDRKQRNAWLSDTFKRTIRTFDDLTGWERSKAIDLLKEIKEGQKP